MIKISFTENINSEVLSTKIIGWKKLKNRTIFLFKGYKGNYWLDLHTWGKTFPDKRKRFKLTEGQVTFILVTGYIPEGILKDE